MKAISYKVITFLYKLVNKGIIRLSVIRQELKTARYFLRFEERDDDIYISTFLKSGTTWMQMIVYQLVTDGKMDFDHIYDISPWIRNEAFKEKDPDRVNKLPSPRIIKTHDNYSFFKKNLKARFICVVRNPIDLYNSLVHHVRNYDDPEADFEKITKRYFTQGERYNWYDYIGDWLKNENGYNMLVVSYENLKNNFDEELERIASFLDVTLTDELTFRVKERSSFAFMKEHEEKFGEQPTKKEKKIYDQFIRSGKTGEGSEALPAEIQKDIDIRFAKLFFQNKRLFEQLHIFPQAIQQHEDQSV